MEHNIDINRGVLGWIVYFIGLSIAFIEPITGVLKFIGVLCGAVAGAYKVYEVIVTIINKRDYKKRKRGGI